MNLLNSKWTALVLFLALPLAAEAQKFYTYVGDIGTDRVLIAWGTTAGVNTIGRSSAPHGAVTVRVGTQQVKVENQNYALVTGLSADTEYDYEVSLNGRQIGSAKLRTWPIKSQRMRFFVMGDYGSGDDLQKSTAEAMWREFQKHWGDNPVRFVMTTGDNLYGTFGLTFRFSGTGNADTQWESRVFGPYEQIMARVPFRPSLGNHDGNETESRDDLSTYLDNFFFPGGSPARYYRFNYGGHVDFFALDSTTNSETGAPRPVYLPGSEQHRWLEQNLSQAQVPWKIPFFHHPPFSAGPRHPAANRELAHFLQLFQRHGVKVVFTGHEHNFQFSRKNGQTGDIRYIVSGAGGELRTGNVRRAMESAQIEGWAAKLHYLLVEIEGNEMRIHPKGVDGDLAVLDRDGNRIAMPIRITAQ